MQEKTKLTRWLTVILSFLALIAFAISAIYNYKINRNQFEWARISRENEIRPQIVLTPKSQPNLKDNSYLIQFKNIGGGTAKYIILCISANTEFVQFALNSFKLDMDSLAEQNYIQPGEILETSFLLGDLISKGFEDLPENERIKLLMNVSWYYYFSYYDIDGNEYLSISRFPAYDITGPLLWGEQTTFDSLWNQAKDIQQFSQKTIINPGFRKDIPLLIYKDSVNFKR